MDEWKKYVNDPKVIVAIEAIIDYPLMGRFFNEYEELEKLNSFLITVESSVKEIIKAYEKIEANVPSPETYIPSLVEKETLKDSTYEAIYTKIGCIYMQRISFKCSYESKYGYSRILRKKMPKITRKPRPFFYTDYLDTSYIGSVTSVSSNEDDFIEF